MWLIELFLGFLTSFLGSLPVGMISLVVVELTVRQGVRAGAWTSLGVSVVETLQVMVCLVGISYFVQYPLLKTIVLLVSVPVLVFMGIQHLRSDGTLKKKTDTEKAHNPFRRGLFISSLNTVVFPFWILWGGVYISQGRLLPEWLHFGIFALGAGIGVFVAMLLYVAVGVLAHDKLQRYNKWFNRIIGILFLGIAATVIYSIVKQLAEG